MIYNKRKMKILKQNKALNNKYYQIELTLVVVVIIV